MQTPDSARQLLALYDPALGKPIPEQSYAEDCTIYTPNNPKGAFHNVEVCAACVTILDVVCKHVIVLVQIKFDVFVLCHAIGWWVKVSQSDQLNSLYM